MDAGSNLRHPPRRRHPLFRANFDRVAATLHGLQPDMLVHTGDASLDGADQEADLAFAAASHARLPARSDASLEITTWAIIPNVPPANPWTTPG